MNWSYKITDPNHPKCGTTLWSGRYTAVCGIVLVNCKQDIFVLLEKWQNFNGNRNFLGL